MVTRDQVIDEARTWLGVPWRHLGRNRAGIDCVGLGVVVLRDLNLNGYDIPAYGRQQSPELMRGIRRIGEEINIKDLQPGDFVLVRDGVYPFHVAIYSHRHGVPHLIHAHAKRRKVIEEPLAHELVALVAHAFKLRGID